MTQHYPEFSHAIARAKDAAQHWWEQHGQKNLKAQRYQAQVWQKTMSARFEDYKESKALDPVAQNSADWLQAIVELAAERTKPRLEQAVPVEVQVVDANRQDAE